MQAERFSIRCMKTCVAPNKKGEKNRKKKDQNRDMKADKNIINISYTKWSLKNQKGKNVKHVLRERICWNINTRLTAACMLMSPTVTLSTLMQNNVSVHLKLKN